MQALYRKYRSRALSEVVGQEHITDTLASAIKNGRISHAYLFTGPRGVGKTSVARILAYEINKMPYTDDQQLDIIEIDAASNRRIDDIRDLRDKVHIAPVAAAYKVYIIDEVHMLTGESFNALLKTLEEPPSHVIFILATTEAHKLPATIVSRTQRYSFRPVVASRVQEHLRFIADQEKIAIDDEALQLIAEYGEGSFRDSISLLDQLANIGSDTITAKVIEQNLGLAPRAAIDELIGALKRKDHTQIAAQLATLGSQGATTASLLPQLLRALQSAAQEYPDLYTLLDRLLEVPRAFNPQIKLLAVLVGYTLTGNSSNKEPTAKQTSPAAKVTKPAVEVAILPIAEPPTPEATDARPPVGEAAASKLLSELTLEQWALVLARIKEASAPLYSVFRQAEPLLDSEKQTVTLRFKYQLHSRRAEDSKAQIVLTKAMLSVFECAPIIKTEVVANMVVPKQANIQAAVPVLDETAQSVVSLMGGGEAVTG